MKLAPLLARYGYWTVLVGAFLEGETVVLLGGFFAHRGELYLPLVMACAFAGSLAGDQLAYFVGRRFGDRVLDWRPKWRPTAERARHELERRGTFLLVSFRFFYGLRNAVPFVAGVAGVPPRRFIPLNAIGALLWAPAISTLGYVFGRAVESALNRARHYEEIAFVIIIVIGLCLFLIHRLRNRAAARHEHDAQG
ncbi:MAG TPA: DedA family protein [Polyangiaceae bacterium]|nr:DedA family protein [Polyangiaceae bacterium]